MSEVNKILKKEVKEVLASSILLANENKHKFVTLYHVFYEMLNNDDIDDFFIENCKIDILPFKNEILSEIYKINDTTADGEDAIPVSSLSMFYVYILDAFRDVVESSDINVNENFIDVYNFMSLLLSFLIDAKEQGLKLSISDIVISFFDEHGKGIDYIIDLLSKESSKNAEKFKVSVNKKISKNRNHGEGGEIPDEIMNLADVIIDGKSKAPDTNKFLSCVNDLVVSPDYSDLVIGREEEIQTITQILAKKSKSNPLIIGKNGVGKTSLVYELVNQIEQKNISPKLLNKKVYQLNINSLLAGAKYRGQLEERVLSVIDFIKSDPKNILFIDDIHNLISLGGQNDIMSMMRSEMSKPSFRCISTTNQKDFFKMIKSDKSLERIFQTVDIPEPSIEQVVEIIEGKSSHYEKYHNVLFKNELLKKIVLLSDRYIYDQAFPDKAIDIIDTLGSLYSSKIAQPDSKGYAKESDLLRVVGKRVNIDLGQKDSDMEKIINIESNLKKKIYGQDHVIESIASSLFVSAADIGNKEKPFASMLFTGSTGVGKTEVVKELQRTLQRPLHRFDMSEFSEKHTVSKIIGSPSGYVGYGEGGLLTKAVLNNPYSIILLDEIEKAHPDVFNLFLQVLDDGFLTDSLGNKVSFRNTIIIMTSNAGVQERSVKKIGFEKNEVKVDNKILLNYFKPEFLNRISTIVEFNALTPEIMELIASKNLSEVSSRLSDKSISLKYTPKVKSWLALNGFDQKMGARPMERLVNKKILEPIARQIILSGSKKIKINTVKLKVKSDEIVFEVD